MYILIVSKILIRHLISQPIPDWTVKQPTISSHGCQLLYRAGPQRLKSRANWNLIHASSRSKKWELLDISSALSRKLSLKNNATNCCSHSWKLIQSMLISLERGFLSRRLLYNTEFISRHPIITKMHKLKDENSELASLLAKQLFANAMVCAGLLDDARPVVANMNELLALALEKY